jgi:hypothetical protein
MREWLRYERMIATERGRIRRRRGPVRPAARKARNALAPRWLITLDLILGALMMIGRAGPLVWLFGAFVTAFAVVIIASLLRWIIVLVGLYIAFRVLRRYFAYRTARDEVPF